MEMLFDEPFSGNLDPYHSSLIHRGMNSADWSPLSSLERRDLFHAERHLLRNFQKYARTVAVDLDRTWEWLAIGQHHGLPTRLMDWTYSPLVALHFATDDLDTQRDGVVWSLDYARAHARLPPNVSGALTNGATAFTTEMLDDSEIDPWTDTGDSAFDAYLLVLEPPSLDDRIVNQYAGLSMLSSKTISTEEWLTTFEDPVAIKTLVPAALKREVREKLDKANITERIIYPGLDGLSRWLGRYYTSPPRHWVLPDAGAEPFNEHL